MGATDPERVPRDLRNAFTYRRDLPDRTSEPLQSHAKALFQCASGPQQEAPQMSSRVAAVLYVLAMVVVIVGVDFLFLRDRFWERLAANVAIVVVFGAVYLLFLRRG